MSQAPSIREQVSFERITRRRAIRLIVLNALLTGLTLASQFTSVLGAEVGALHWSVGGIAGLFLIWAVLLFKRSDEKIAKLEVRGASQRASGAEEELMP